jgi:hypothetical protein
MLSKNFSREEFACQCGCGSGEISMDLVRRLQEVRDALGEPMKITSGIRCSSHNSKVGGSVGSSHMPDSRGIAYAVDIACDNSVYREKLLTAMMPIMDRTGISKTFVHCDVDAFKTAGVCWLY